MVGRFGGYWVEFSNRFGWCLAILSTIWLKTVLLLLAD